MEINNSFKKMKSCNWKKEITISNKLKKLNFDIIKVDSNDFISLTGTFLDKNLEKWECQASFSTQIFSVWSVDKIFIKNFFCGGYYDTLKLVYAIDEVNLKIVYLSQEILALSNPEIGNIYELSVFQFEELLIKNGYKKLTINFESKLGAHCTTKSQFYRFLTHLLKEYCYVIPSYDGFWIKLDYDSKNKLWRPNNWPHII